MKILIIEDHQLFVEGLSIILADLVNRPEIICANNAKEALRILGETEDIKLILMDIGLPDIDGRALLKIIRSQGYAQPLLVVSGSEDVQVAQQMIATDAQGYVLKSSSREELRKALKNALNGKTYMPEEWEGIVAASRGCGQEASPAGQLKITGRQLDVLYLMAQGHPNKIIADWLGLSEHTIKTHIQGLFDALSVHNRTACVREAEKLGLLKHMQSGPA